MNGYGSWQDNQFQRIIEALSSQYPSVSCYVNSHNLQHEANWRS